jgi:hypothetical protein
MGEQAIGQIGAGMNATYDIIDVAALEQAVVKANKRAEKLGVSPIVFERLAHKDEIDQAGKVTRTWTVSLIGDQPRLAGWSLLGVLEHLTGVDRPLVRAVPGCEIPVAQRTRGQVCDHCGSNRRRSECVTR